MPGWTEGRLEDVEGVPPSRAAARGGRVADAKPTKPTEVSEERGRFDAIADRASTLTARSGFFVAVLAAVLAWLAFGPLTGFSHH